MKWDEAVKSGYLNVSPSLMKNHYRCNKMAALKTTETSWSNVHTMYGHAYGSGSVELVKHQKLEKQSSRVTAALLKGLPYIKEHWDASKPIHGKNLEKLMLGLIETDVWVQTHPMNFYSEEEKVVVQIADSLGRTVGWLSGTYDLCTKNPNGDKVIDDFKAVTSLNYYSFPSDTQIPFYTVLNILKDIINGVPVRWSARGKYIAHVTKKHMPLEVVPLQLGSVANLIVPHMRECIKAAKNLYNASDKEVVNRLNLFGVNPHECERTSFQCEYNSFCAKYPSGVKQFENSIVDDRKPSNVHHIIATEADIMEATEVYKELAAAEHQLGIKSIHKLDAEDTVAVLEDLLDEDFGL